MNSHQDIDRRSLDMHRLVAQKIMREPHLFDKVKENLSLWRLSSPQSRASAHFDEWKSLFEHGIDACLSMATNDSEKARELRQSSPFSGILTTEERLAFLRSWKADNEA